eukprot:6751728-Prymnesium_polylepis.2
MRKRPRHDAACKQASQPARQHSCEPTAAASRLCCLTRRPLAGGGTNCTFPKDAHKLMLAMPADLEAAKVRERGSRFSGEGLVSGGGGGRQGSVAGGRG